MGAVAQRVCSHYFYWSSYIQVTPILYHPLLNTIRQEEAQTGRGATGLRFFLSYNSPILEGHLDTSTRAAARQFRNAQTADGALQGRRQLSTIDF